MKSNVAKSLSIGCLLAVIVMHMFSWITFGGDSSATDILLEALEYYTDDIYEEANLEMVQAEFDKVGSDLNIEVFIDDIGDMLNPFMDLGISPVDFLSITSGYIGVIDFMSSPDLIDVVGDNLIDGDPDLELGLNIIRIVLIIEVVLLIATIIVTVLQIVCHLMDRKGLGISVPIITFINIIYVGVIWLFVNALFSDITGGQVFSTTAPFFAWVCGVLACIFWEKARKDIDVND